MAFDHKLMATHGLMPNPGTRFHRQVANLGHFKITVAGGLGSTTDLNGRKKDKYTVYITVGYKDRTWEYSKVVSRTMANVIAKMADVVFVPEKVPEIELTSVREVKPAEPQVKVDKK